MRRRSWISAILAGLLAASISPEALASDFGPFQGKIVDAATKEPVEGAVVFVAWYQTHFFAGSTFYDAQETLTDRDGQFTIPGIWVLNPWRHFSVDAGMIAYKSGYLAITTGAFRSWSQINHGLDYVLMVEDGKPTLLLKKLTMAERRQDTTPGTGDIPHVKKRLLIREINKERRLFGLGEVTD